jgi:membrane protein insertase Oxa1/YidC/SpoIIIJ
LNLFFMLSHLKVVGKHGQFFVTSLGKHRSRNVFVNQRRNLTDAFGPETINSIPTFIQAAVTTLQATTDAPWWATFGMSTLFARALVFPFVRSQVLSSRKLSAAMPEITFLVQLMKTRVKAIDAANITERIRVVPVFFKGVNACFKLNDVSKMQIFVYPFANMAIFMTFVYSLRQMIVDDGNMFIHGGMLWFPDLAARDATFALPLMAVSLTYLATEVSFSSAQPGVAPSSVSVFLKDTIQSFMVLSVPVVSVLPAGVFCYWIPSTLFGMLQTQLFRSNAGSKLLGLPPLQYHAPPPDELPAELRQLVPQRAGGPQQQQSPASPSVSASASASALGTSLNSEDASAATDVTAPVVVEGSNENNSDVNSAPSVKNDDNGAENNNNRNNNKELPR